MSIRLASFEDIEGIAKVHMNSWRTTYRGIISESYLSNITLESRIKNWIWTFNNLKQDEVIYILEDELNQIVGFINGGKSRESGFHYNAELYAIYLIEEAQGKGFGRLLFNKLVEALKRRNFNSMMLWVLEDNSAVNFYKKLGGQFITRKEIQIGEDKLFEVALGWNII